MVPKRQAVMSGRLFCITTNRTEGKLFNRKKRQQELLRKIEMISPTSKSALKKECLYLCNLDVDKAERMYDFLVKDMADIPDVAPAQRSFIENFGDQANGVIGWIEEHRDFFGKVFDTVQGIVSKRKGSIPVPPSAPLPPINQ